MSTTTSAPDRSLQQRLGALERANGIRSARAQVKRDLRAGRCRFADLLRDPPAWLETAHVFDVLLAVPKVGRVKATRVFRQVGASPSKTFAGMTLRQREDLLRELGPRA